MNYLCRIKFKPSAPFCRLPREKPIKKIYGFRTIYHNDEHGLREIIYPKSLWLQESDFDLERKLIEIKTVFPLWETIEIIEN